MKKIVITSLLLVSLIFSISAITSESYETGDTVFGLSIGTSFNPGIAWFDSSNYNNYTTMYPGGNGSISFMYFLLPDLRIGGEIGYFFNYTKKSTLVKSVPLTFNLSWAPRYKIVDFPITLKIGGTYLSHGEYHYFAPLINLSFGTDFYINKNWGIGLETGVTAIGEFYSQNTKRNNINFMIPLTLNVKFRR